MELCWWSVFAAASTILSIPGCEHSMPRISSAIAGWLLVKTRSGSLPGEGNLPIETVTALNAKTAKAPALTVPPLRADEVIE